MGNPKKFARTKVAPALIPALLVRLFRRMVSLEVINDAYARLKLLCAAAYRLFQTSAKDNRNLRKPLGNARADRVTPPVAILKIDTGFVARAHRPSLRKD